jgi:hypothetical protein
MSDSNVIASSACRGVCGATTVVGIVNRAADRLELLVVANYHASAVALCYM